ncbi:MAG TPA: A/G-specific adenine glycosylase [Rhizomicrobium sp.]|nr:A/G-specific adenine glycosylase [Rhizomicrobium sp.]
MKASPAKKLLAWYDRHHRELPWRAKRGERADPYRVWLSEIMLQQTTVQAVGPYFKKFLTRWPNVKKLAAAPLDDVLAAWAGLGYYARARNLHRAAKVVAEELGGKFPQTAAELQKLPGIGHYTAGAIAAIAFDEREAAVDANAERVIARLYAVDEPLPAAKVKLRALTQSLVPEKRAGDFAQALMDLGATICTPKRPACNNCPWNEECEARKRGIQETLPVKGAKAIRPLRRGAAFVARDAKGAVLLVKRPEKGLLGSMLQPPLGPWTENFPSKKEALLQAPFEAEWKKLNGIVRHGFTHFELEIEVYAASTLSPVGGEGRVRGSLNERKSTGKKRKTSNSSANGEIPLTLTLSPEGGEGIWVAQSELGSVALPTVMRKIIAHALSDSGPLFR